MRTVKRCRWLALAAAVAAVPRLEAQSYFGQNQVQYDNFHWRVLETEHFYIHYYPEEREATVDAGRMAERAYARLSRILNHQFREKKPIMLFASRADFAQSNVFGDLGEGTGGVTEPLRHRMALFYTGDYRSFEHVLTHEMVHEFQFDIFARGKAGQGLQTLAQVDPPLWFAEGMAEYLSLGPDHRLTDLTIADAALNGKLPTIEQMTERPERYFPYRYGESLWAYIGQRWGDEVIGQIMNAAPNVGIERAFKRELGMSLEDLSDEWREAMQTKYLPAIAALERPRKFAQPLLTERKSGGEIFLAPTLSSDGKYVAFLSNGSFLRGEVFIDLWLGDAQTGKRIKRLVKSTTDPNFEELRFIYSQSAFSPDGRLLAFTAQRSGKDVLYILDVKRRQTVKRLDLPLEGAISPSWSPDGRRLVFSGNRGGITDLFIVDADGTNLRQLTDDRYGDLQPQWSPDGKTIAFATDRGEETDIDLLRFGKWKIALLNLASGEIAVLPGQRGLNLNPMWAPDSRSVAYISDRTGTANVFLYDLDAKEHFQLTNLVGGVSGLTEYSPAITWAHGADRLAFTYYEDGDYTVWAVNNPRALKRAPFRDAPPAAAATTVAQRADSARPAAAADSATASPLVGSVYRSASGFRPSAYLPEGTAAGAKAPVTVAALLDSAALALPDTSRFKDYAYHVRFSPDYVARPTIGYAQDNFGRGVFGGTTVILSDMLGNNRLAFSGQVNGRLDEAFLYAAYTNLGHRFQYGTGGSQVPYFFLSGDTVIAPTSSDDTYHQRQEITRYIIRQAFGVGIYPLNRFTRFELGANFNSIAHSVLIVERLLYPEGASAYYIVDELKRPAINYAEPFGAYVSDNALFGYTGPIFGRRYRFQVSPAVGSYRWVEGLADYRRYDPIFFNYLTVATRLMSAAKTGRDEDVFPYYIGRSDFVRGYDRQSFLSYNCTGLGVSAQTCNATQLLGSHFALFNAELRFPVIQRFELGLLPLALPPLDGLVFFDAGLAWNRGQRVTLARPQNYNAATDRYVLRSYGAGLRLNLFNFAILRFDYAIPLDAGDKRQGFWTWSLGPSY